MLEFRFEYFFSSNFKYWRYFSIFGIIADKIGTKKALILDYLLFRLVV